MRAKDDDARRDAIMFFDIMSGLLRYGFPLPDSEMMAGVRRYCAALGSPSSRGPIRYEHVQQCVLLLAFYTASDYVVQDPNDDDLKHNPRNACRAVALNLKQRNPNNTIKPANVFQIYRKRKADVHRLRDLLFDDEHDKPRLKAIFEVPAQTTATRRPAKRK